MFDTKALLLIGFALAATTSAGASNRRMPPTLELANGSKQIPRS
jgi:hypothetical protein